MLGKVAIGGTIGLVLGAAAGFVAATLGYPGWAVGVATGIAVPIVYVLLMGKPGS
jgi:hypothetical protein